MNAPGVNSDPAIKAALIPGATVACPRCGRPAQQKQITETSSRGTTVRTVLAGCGCDASAVIPAGMTIQDVLGLSGPRF